MASESKVFSHEELARHNGQDQPTVYVAHAGKVYDVTESKLWKTGNHMKRHPSGQDLTEEIGGAPHGPEVLERCPQVGTMAPEKDPMDEGIPDWILAVFKKVPMLRRHPHPMTVHFPLVFNLLVPLFSLLYVFTGHEPFEDTAFHMLVLCIPATIVGMLTGPLTWWFNYGAKMNRNIRVKLTMSAVLLVLTTTALIWRIRDPAILTQVDAVTIAYLALTCSFAIVVGVLGWFGAKMTFPH